MLCTQKAPKPILGQGTEIKSGTQKKVWMVYWLMVGDRIQDQGDRGSPWIITVMQQCWEKSVQEKSHVRNVWEPEAGRSRLADHRGCAETVPAAGE